MPDFHIAHIARFAASVLTITAFVTVSGCTSGSSASDSSTKNTVAAETAQTGSAQVGQRVDGSLKLKNAQGETVTLASMYEDQPIVLTFYRGKWCPFCQKALKQWQSKTGELNSAGGRLVAVSMENLSDINEAAGSWGLSYDVLSDYSGGVSDAFDLTFQLDAKTVSRYKGYGIDLAKSNVSGEWELPVPGTFVIDTDGVIRYAYNDPNYQVRADPDEVIGVVSRLN